MSTTLSTKELESNIPSPTFGKFDPSKLQIYTRFQFMMDISYDKSIVAQNEAENLGTKLSSQIKLDNKINRLPDALSLLCEQIRDAKEILSYEDDWDDDGGLATNQATFKMAYTFVLKYALYLYNTYTVVLKTPYIDIMPDGSISVFWEEKNAQLLIIFKKDNFELAHYYAESTDRKVPFKSAIEPNGEVDEMLITWMKKNLT